MKEKVSVRLWLLPAGRCVVMGSYLLGMLCWDRWNWCTLSIFHFSFLLRLGLRANQGIGLREWNQFLGACQLHRLLPWLVRVLAFLRFCLTGLNVGSTFRSWEVILMSNPGMSAADHANFLIFFLRKDKRSFLTSGGRSFPMLMPFSGEFSSRAMMLDRFLAGSFTVRSRTSETFSPRGASSGIRSYSRLGIVLAPTYGFSPVGDKNFKSWW